MENIEINYRNVIIDDLLEEYKLDFFKRYEELKVHYLDFLNIEKNKIISILKNQREICKNGLLEYLDENGDTAEFFKLCGKHTIQILEDYKNKILQEKNVDSDTIYDISTDILEDYGLMEYTDENLETEDFLIEYLKTYTYSFFFPDYEISKHRIYNFIENEILITTKDIKNKSESESEIENIPLKDAETGIDIDLLKYLSDNFKGGKTPLTKYNQIYRYFSDGEDINIPQIPYKKLIEKLFGFNYGKSDITRAITKHTNTLKNHAINYKDSKK